MKQRTSITDAGAGIQKMPVRMLDSVRFEVTLAGKRKENSPPPANPPDLDGWETIEFIAAGYRLMPVMNPKQTPKGHANGVRE